MNRNDRERVIHTILEDRLNSVAVSYTAGKLGMKIKTVSGIYCDRVRRKELLPLTVFRRDWFALYQLMIASRSTGQETPRYCTLHSREYGMVALPHVASFMFVLHAPPMHYSGALSAPREVSSGIVDNITVAYSYSTDREYLYMRPFYSPQRSIDNVTPCYALNIAPYARVRVALSDTGVWAAQGGIRQD